MTIPLDKDYVALFLTHLHRNGYSFNTVKTHVSAISYVHKLENIVDPTSGSAITALLNAIKKESPKSLGKLHISEPSRFHSTSPTGQRCVRAVFQRVLIM